ncbi:hypothetical protein KO516_10905 [Citreicella sp. C3M06]|uniref:hypothetical protein n=1 Tax=Citreicella sp. C3M06 TaxID=2841564 RepID=UPI001C0A596F|nr:hypothetical protein [Citreicella sp. C3M06]
MQIRFRKGRDFDMGPAAANTPAAVRAVRRVGLEFRGFPGLIVDALVAEGDPLRRGQTLCVSRHHPEIAFVASAAGRVSRIRKGARRRIETIEIAVEGDEECRFDVEPAQTDDAALRALLLQSGAWVAFRTRPFGRIPAPADQPSAIFVTATAGTPLAPDPAQVLAPQLDAFARGLEALLRLTQGAVFVCQPPGPALVTPRERLRIASICGPQPCGLPGPHIHRLWPVSAQRSVWQIGYQDVAAIGDLLSTGRISVDRSISVAGPGCDRARLLRAPLGAELAGLLDETQQSEKRLISGSALTGREQRFLGRHDLEVTVMTPASDAPRGAVRGLVAWLRQSGTGATLPSEAFERLFPFDLLPVPLMRALAVGDIETVERLGGLELLEEDLALLSWRCPSGSDYGSLLRRALDRLAEERAP